MNPVVKEYEPLPEEIVEETASEESAELPSVGDQQYLLNRELSWIEFNRRVLEEALDETTPLLERLKFLSIFSTNLDEFFMIRVSGHKENAVETPSKLSIDGMMPQEILDEITRRLRPILAEQMQCLREEILPRLSEAGIEICPFDKLNAEEKERLHTYFLNIVFPILTPQAVDISHPFPYISNQSLNLGVFVKPEKNLDHGKLQELYGDTRFVRIKLPSNLPRLVAVNDEETKFVLLEEMIAANLKYLFPNMKPKKAYLFRVTRDADIEVREDEAGDLLRRMESELYQIRRFSFPVRLEVSADMPEEMVEYLTNAIHLKEQDVYRLDGILNIPDLMKLYDSNRPDLKDEQIAYSFPTVFNKKENIFDTLKKHDVLIHHPYTAYNAVTDFIDAAAEDEAVRAIKICLYRTGKNSPIVKSLIKANRNGKQVAALVELKARFDEENNIEWARRLESEGVHVIYGIRSLKTHSKVTLVVRSENDEMRRYVHIATGNYNPTTSKIYTDLGLLTADKEIGADASDLFNFLTGYSYQTDYKKLLVAPINLRERMLELINREIENQQNGKDGHIIVKINSLTDDKIIRALYRASQAGVKIDLIIRGICVLRPGIKDLSENIRVISVVGRFLEHSRIFYFANGGKEEVYIGSADWMHRNLDRRVEAVVQIKNKKLAKYLREEILGAYLKDNVNSRILNENGEYRFLNDELGDEKFDSQMYFVGQEIS